MDIRQNKDQDINIINPQIYKEKKTIEGKTWIVPLIVMILACIIMIAVVLDIVYDKSQSKMELDTNYINEWLDKEFNIAINSIELNGYMEVFEQYMKTTSNDATTSIYYTSATKTLDNITNISDNIETTFMISFKNKELVLSGVNNDIIKNYDYSSQKWYDYGNICENKMYVSKGFELQNINDKKLFAIVRPIVDSMNDEPLGVIAICYDENYLQKVFDSKKNNKIETVIYTDDGVVLLNTSSIKNIKTIVDGRRNKYLVNRRENNNLGWIVETYRSYTDIFFDGWIYIAIIIIIFGLIIYLYCNLIRHLVKLKVIYRREKIKEIQVKEVVQEEKIEPQVEELTLDEVLSTEEIQTETSSNVEDEVIIAGEIIYNKK